MKMSMLNRRDSLRFAFVLGLVLTLVGCSRNDPTALIGSAKSYLAKGDYPAAIIELKTTLQQAPENAEARFLLAKSLLESGDPTGAETEARKALSLGFAPDEVYPLLARAMLFQGASKKVLAELTDRKLSGLQARSDLGTTIATAQLSVGDLTGARSTINAVIGEDPANARALLVQAQLDAVAGDIPAALKRVDAM